MSKPAHKIRDGVLHFRPQQASVPQARKPARQRPLTTLQSQRNRVALTTIEYSGVFVDGPQPEG